MERIIKNEYIRNANRIKIREALKVVGFSEQEHALSKVDWFKDLIHPENNTWFNFVSKYGDHYGSGTYKVGYEIIYNYDFTDTVTFLIHVYPDVCYEFNNIEVPDEVMLNENIKEKFIDFLDEKLKILHDNIDITGYTNLDILLK